MGEQLVGPMSCIEALTCVSTNITAKVNEVQAGRHRIMQSSKSYCLGLQPQPDAGASTVPHNAAY